jgi:hypothetical protein
MENKVLFSLCIIGVLFFPFGLHAEVSGEGTKGDVRITTYEISYGKGKEDIGAYNRGEGAAMGPRSFTVDEMGNVFICDTVNERIQRYSPSGEYLSTISLAEGTVADDIVVDSAGSVYVYDDSIGLLSQHDRNGNRTSSLSISRRWYVRGALRIMNGSIYMYTCNRKICGDIIVARIADGRLTPPTPAEARRPLEKGTRGLSGRKYMTDMSKFRRGLLGITGEDGKSEETISFPLKGITALKFLGEDESGNLFIKTRRRNSGAKSSIEEIQIFDAEGVLQQTVKLPEHASDFWSTRNYYLTKDGAIYQFLPKTNRVTINVYEMNPSGGTQ